MNYLKELQNMLSLEQLQQLELVQIALSHERGHGCDRDIDNSNLCPKLGQEFIVETNKQLL
ncbi:MAG: hypothetical protein DDT42_01844 [candidate division WS2 bacterium]|uniref:Uncharacterized protein n=1 Tax=Psychracetigena formicireducens TaxID=2986056 RepID=A0A9E2F728_PSYF1|nr:hypothetical protein [Candidatus Psychracetigena formicireducens]